MGNKPKGGKGSNQWAIKGQSKQRDRGPGVASGSSQSTALAGAANAPVAVVDDGVDRSTTVDGYVHAKQAIRVPDGPELQVEPLQQTRRGSGGFDGEGTSYMLFVTAENGVEMELPYHTGSGIDPATIKPGEGLGNISTSALIYENAVDQLDYAEEFGYDPIEDADRISEVWDAMGRIHVGFKKMGVNLDDLNEMCEEEEWV